jgi:hypothetical protein
MTVGGVKITGEADSYSGASVAKVGDVNRDGKTDLIIGATWGIGHASIVFGKGSETCRRQSALALPQQTVSSSTVQLSHPS